MVELHERTTFVLLLKWRWQEGAGSPAWPGSAVPLLWRSDVLPLWRSLDQHWETPYIHPSNYPPSWPNIQKCYTVHIYQTTDRNIVIIISLSYITSFTQHKNRSLTMITIFLSVNLLYIYCIFKEIYFFNFFIYSVVTISLGKKKDQRQTHWYLWVTTDVRHGPAGGAASLRMKIQSWTSFFLHGN